MGEIGPFAMVVLIVLIVTIGRSYRSRHRAEALSADSVSYDEAVRMKAEITRLNERIQVLERLATDPSRRLADQIDALDDKR